MPPEYLIDGPEVAEVTVISAHGAGAPMDTPFMTHIAQSLANFGHRVIRFEFPYMRRRRLEGTRSPPNPAAKLIASCHQAIKDHPSHGDIFLAGKSMGGRIASMIADDSDIAGVMCLGYPFHPPGKPEKRRTAHLETLTRPCLILQGTRDPFGKPEEVQYYALSKSIEVFWLPDGDHSLKPRKSSGYSEAAHLHSAAEKMHQFMKSNGKN